MIRCGLPFSDPPIGIAEFFGVDRCHPFCRNQVFLIAMAAGPIFWIAWAFLTPVSPLSWSGAWSLGFLSGALWQPITEELLFRGVIQGALRRAGWIHAFGESITLANLATSLLFMAGHWFSHPPLWALSVFVPSLIFGLMRDRLQSTCPAIVLHVFYNAGYLLLAGI